MAEKSSTSKDDSCQNDTKTESADLPSIDPRKIGTPTDFTINVEDKSFNVHRDIITGKSEYFKAMLAHDTKENQQGFVDMKDVNPDVVRECIEFMYTGNVDEVSVDIENVGDVLQAAEIIQLNEIKDVCSKCLEGNLQTKNCVIYIFNLAKKFNFADLQDNVQEVFVETYELDSVAEMLELSKLDFIEYLRKHHLADVLITWDCIKHWMEYDPDNRSEILFELLSLLNWDEFPPYTFLRRLWNNSIFKHSQQCLDLVHESVFMDFLGFEKNLSVESFFLLKEMSKRFKFIPKQIKEILPTFFKTHIVKLLTKSEFKKFTEVEMMAFLSDPSIDDLIGEKWKWLAVETWLNNEKDRKAVLPRLLGNIRFQTLPKSFIKKVLEHPLTRDSLENNHTITDALMMDSPSFSSKTHYLAVLYSNGKIRALNMSTRAWEVGPAIHLESSSQMFSFNDRLCVLTGNRLFYMTQTQKWIEKASMVNKIGDSAKVVTTNDHIYVIETSRMSCYDSSTDSWNENLSGVGLIEFGAAVANGSIYVSGGRKMRIYDLKNKIWSETSDVSYAFIFAACLVGCLYFSSRSRIYDNYNNFNIILQKFSFEQSNWSCITSPLPRSNTGSNSHAQSLLNINNSMVLISSDGSIYIYNEYCSTWNKMYVNVPILYCDTNDSSLQANIASICTYFTY